MKRKKKKKGRYWRYSATDEPLRARTVYEAAAEEAAIKADIAEIKAISTTRTTMTTIALIGNTGPR
jgi:hypothetical protein